MGWAALFERGARFEVTEDAVRAALADRRSAADRGTDAGEAPPGSDGPPDPVSERSEGETTAAMARVVADADVLAADLLCGGPAREALDLVRGHDWVTLVASDPLLDDATAVVRTLSAGALAGDWEAAIRELAELVAHPPGDHPALACAYRGGAAHVLSFDEALLSAGAAVAIRARVETSVKTPAGFVRLFDPAAMHEVVVGGPYPGPDRDPWA